jgi:DNA topoisomerase-1
MGKKTLIVESPTKAKTISRYLGKDFTVVSTVGHIRDLPKSKLGVDIEHNFEPQYETITGKTRVITALKDAIKGADEIYIAPDPDREGEAIGWHVAQLLKKPVKRVEFHEVTKQAVQEALKHPREIDMHRVDAQQARRVLDRLVGYQISPLMWRKIKPGLSAGRVQSVAVRLICEREREIEAFKPQEFWSFDGEFSADGSSFSAGLARIDGLRVARPDGEENRDGTEGAGPSNGPVNDGKTITIRNAAEAEALVAEMNRTAYTAGELSTRKQTRRPGPPFTTSTLQQDAARKFGWSGKRTMQIAQQLYEGIDVGSGAEGLITYMRTDSVRVGAQAVEAVRDLIGSRFGADFLPEKANFYKTKSDAQDAHEAIRPTAPSRTPESVGSFLSTDQFKLYSLIWTRFVSSQMTPAEFETAAVDISGGRFVFRATSTRLVFKGFLAVYGEAREDISAQPIPRLAPRQTVALDDVKSNQHFTKAPPRYTDATLVKALEEQGIGRPSTYAAIIDTIIQRNYVVRSKRAFEPTEWGYVTTEMMQHYFPDVVDTGFTRDMEERLDSIEEGKADWREVLRGFYTPFSTKLAEAAAEKRYFKAQPKVTEHVCDKCGAPMVLRHGKFGPFLSCSTYPKCENIKNLDDKGNIIDRPVSEAGQKVDYPCPKCGKDLYVKTSRWGTKFIGCSGYPKCDYTSELQTKCPKCGNDLIKKTLKTRKVILVCSKNEASQGQECDFTCWGKPLLETCPLCGFWLMEEKIRGTDRWRRKCSNQACPNYKGVGDSTDEDVEEEDGEVVADAA